jgi:hypothetical protein
MFQESLSVKCNERAIMNNGTMWGKADEAYSSGNTEEAHEK